MTGRGRGLCVESGQFASGRFGGFGGFGRGWRNRYFATGTPGPFWGRGFDRHETDLSSSEKKEMLEDEAKYFERQLKHIREELKRLGKPDSDDEK
jgi:hypothetical protein